MRLLVRCLGSVRLLLARLEGWILSDHDDGGERGGRGDVVCNDGAALISKMRERRGMLAASIGGEG